MYEGTTKPEHIVSQEKALAECDGLFFLAMFHGRPADDINSMDDWGTQGPMIPIQGLHATYVHHIRVKLSSKVKAAWPELDAEPDYGGEWYDVPFKEECLVHAGIAYGDWCIVTMNQH